MLMVETGGWFILGCPLSQVSKPQLKGAIYRISKQGANRVTDPYGNQIGWESLTIEAVAKYLKDPRGFVSDKAQQALIAAGDQAIGILSEVLKNAIAPEVRLKALFGLYQIGTDQAIQAILPGFQDQDLEVKLAAARIAGLTKHDVFKPVLMDLLTSEEAPLVRQSATALGQLKAEEAVPHLIQAGASTKDSFVKHAVTYALISIDRFDTVVEALGSASSSLTSMMLMALEFMPSGKLGSDQVLPYLVAEGMSEAALRVATRHPEWSAELVAYLNQRLKTSSFSEEQLSAYQPLITNYCGTKEMQGFLSHLLLTGDRKEREFAMASMGKCAQDPFPKGWKEQLAYVFENSKDASTLTEAVALVKLRGLTEMVKHLDRIGESDSYPAILRISAIEASLAETQKLTEAQFSILCGQLAEGISPIIAQQAGRTIASAELSAEQLSYISNSILPSLDPFLLPALLPAYQRSTDLETGKHLASYLVTLPSLDNFTEDYILDLFKAYPQEIEPHLDPLIQQLVMVRQQRFKRIEELEFLATGGSEEKGRALYYGKAICSTCHAMRQAGGTLGPDLTSIQKDRSIHDIIEAIVYPSVSFVREYETYQISTGSDNFRGVIKEQTPDMILLETAPGSTVRIPMNEVTSVVQLPVSMMPQGLDKILTEEEFKDLMAYLLAKDLVY
jgi:putative heme-binding domain-containing protein